MSEFQRREAGERQALARQWQIAQRSIAAQQWRGMRLLQDSKFEPFAAQQTVDKLFPSYGDVFGREAAWRPGVGKDEVSRPVYSFANALPDQPKALMGNLDQLLRQRLKDWRSPDLTELGVWSTACRSILDKLANINNCTEYRDSFHKGSAQEAWQILQRKKATDDSWNAWQRADSEVSTLIPQNRAEAQDASALKQKQRALKAIEDGEVKSGVAPPHAALPVIPTNGSMPPVAPQRQTCRSPGAAINKPGLELPQPSSDFGNGLREAEFSHFPRRKLKF